MAHYQQIEYRIGKDGNIVETVLNGDGESCVLSTAPLETALGTVTSRQHLPEYQAEESLPILTPPLVQEI